MTEYVMCSSDGFEIACWNGQVVRVVFALDCCDREIIVIWPTTGGITGEMVRDLMVESVERRFGPTARLPHGIEWLSDNGSCYTARETIDDRITRLMRRLISG
jgi:transposase InsO family protein